jgi:hypothetical protein
VKKILLVFLVIIIISTSSFRRMRETDMDIKHRRSQEYVSKLEVGDTLHIRTLDPLECTRVLSNKDVSVYKIYISSYTRYFITVENTTKVITIISLQY